MMMEVLFLLLMSGQIQNFLNQYFQYNLPLVIFLFLVLINYIQLIHINVKKEIQNAKAQSPGSADDEKDISAETNGGLATPAPNRKEAVSEKLASLSAEVQNKFDELRKQVGFPGDEQAGDVVIAL